MLLRKITYPNFSGSESKFTFSYMETLRMRRNIWSTFTDLMKSGVWSLCYGIIWLPEKKMKCPFISTLVLSFLFYCFACGSLTRLSNCNSSSQFLFTLMDRYEEKRMFRVSVVHTMSRMASRMLADYRPYMDFGSGPLSVSSAFPAVSCFNL